MAQDYNPAFNNHYETQTGVLVDDDAPKQSTGKKLFSWKYVFKLPDRNEGFPVDVYLMPGNVFQARYKHFRNTHTSPSLDQLKKEIEVFMHEQIDLRYGLIWEDWLEVEVSGSDSNFTEKNSYSCLGSELKIRVRRLKRHQTSDGKILAINCNGIVTSFPSPQKISTENKTESGIILDESKEVSYIPATDENLLALNSMIDRMHEIRLKMAEFLSQDNVSNSISLINKGQNLLSEK